MERTDEEKKADMVTVDEAIRAFRMGRMVILVDDEDRENEGDLALPAEMATPDAVNTMLKVASGLLMVAMGPELLDRFGLPQMAPRNTSRYGTAFTVSVDAREGTTTGISAYDRARTIQVLLDESSTSNDLVVPGHVFPLRSQPGGVLKRAGQTEASVDLARLAGLKPAAVLCQVMKEDGTMARMPDLKRLAAKMQIPIVAVADLIAYRMERELLVRTVGQCNARTPYGNFRCVIYEDTLTGTAHMALVRGKIVPGRPTLVRVHSECLTGDVFHSMRCDCGPQFHAALERIGREAGVLLYLRQEGRGIGILNKIRAYALQDKGLDTVEANLRLGFAPDLRNYGIGAQILAHLGVRKMRLLTNNPRKIVSLRGYGLEVVAREPIQVPPRGPLERMYLEAKRLKLGHILKDL